MMEQDKQLVILPWNDVKKIHKPLNHKSVAPTAKEGISIYTDILWTTQGRETWFKMIVVYNKNGKIF